MEEQEKVQVKVVADDSPAPTKQEQEAAVLDKAVETGEVASEYGLQDDGVYKINLDKPPVQKEENNAIQERETKEIPVGERTQDSKEVDEEVREQSSEKSDTVQNETTPPVKEVEKPIEKTTPLPEGIEKLVNFIEETGGDLNDYVRLNQDYSELDNISLLKEYYKQTKPHLDGEEISFLMEDQFSYDEDRDDEKEVKRKKLALKEQVANAKTHLEESKTKYYEDIKAGSKLTTEQQKAVDFFNRYNEEQAENQKGTEHRTSVFHEKTKNVFTDDFKGFEFKVGDKKFRYNVQDANKVKESQSDISNFVGKFLNKNNEMSDAEGYHKSLYTAMNPDAIAKHFYEQGQSDALKQSVEKGKNISMDPRQQHTDSNSGGMKVKVLGDNTASFKFKIKNKN